MQFFRPGQTSQQFLDLGLGSRQLLVLVSNERMSMLPVFPLTPEVIFICFILHYHEKNLKGKINYLFMSPCTCTEDPIACDKSFTVRAIHWEWSFPDHFQSISCLGQTSGFTSTLGRQPLVKCFVVHVCKPTIMPYHSLIHSFHIGLVLHVHWIVSLSIASTALELPVTLETLLLVNLHWTSLDWNHLHLVNGCSTSSTVLHWIASSLAYLNYWL